ncbi:MAG: zinc ribbon domain-containing protein [Lachnospiraceae bacterium]|nr:zinc ribbon domain-containing protein [Lachnospiraceae bacterium]
MENKKNVNDKTGKVDNEYDDSGGLKNEMDVQLRARIDELNERITENYIGIGQQYYLTHANEATGEYAAMIEEIQYLNELLRECQQQMGESSQKKICPKCGAAADPGDIFCGSCGFELPTFLTVPRQSISQRTKTIRRPPQQEKEALFAPKQSDKNSFVRQRYICPQCGTENDPDGEFCWNCGLKMNSEEESAKDKVKLKKKGFLPLRITAFILLLCSFVIPLFSQWGGIIPSDKSWTTITTCTYIRNLGINAFIYRPILLQLTCCIPAIFLMVFSIAKLKVLSVISALLGIAAPLVVIGQTLLHWDYTTFFDPVSGCICIGYYVVLILFLICFALSLRTKKQ